MPGPGEAGIIESQPQEGVSGGVWDGQSTQCYCWGTRQSLPGEAHDCAFGSVYGEAPGYQGLQGCCGCLEVVLCLCQSCCSGDDGDVISIHKEV